MGKKYQPYVLSDRETVVANVSVNVIDLRWKDAPKRYIQLGTVMTAPAYRRQGLSRYLIRQILADWADRCDAVYLYANDAVLDFYPKFGFVRAAEYRAVLTVPPKMTPFRKLDMENTADVGVLRRFCQKSNPFSALPVMDGWGLLMFHCGGALKDCVYYFETLGAVVVAEKYGDMLTVFDVYCDGTVVLAVVLAAVLSAAAAACGCGEICLGFGLKNVPEDMLSPLPAADAALFLLEGKENIFKSHKTMFPLLSHA